MLRFKVSHTTIWAKTPAWDQGERHHTRTAQILQVVKPKNNHQIQEHLARSNDHNQD